MTAESGGGSARLDAAGVIRWLTVGASALERSVDEINGLNVFPVADADTGTNMLVTVRAAAEAAVRAQRAAGDGRVDVARVTVAGAVSGARGNSGTIVSQIVRGLAEHLTPDGGVDAAGLAAGLHAGTRLVTRAVAEPVEGTILSVLRAAAEAAGAAADTGEPSVADSARAAADAAFDALLSTRDQLADNARHGVVDAGGRGLLVLLDALVEVACGTAPPRPRFARVGEVAAHQQAVPVAAGETHTHDTPPRGPHAEYEVMYLLPDATEAAASRLRDDLQAFGDSVVVVADGTPDPSATWSVHTHTTEPGRAVQAGLGHGAIRNIAVTVLADATEHTPLQALLDAPRTLVALVCGDGAAELFESEGAQVIRCDGGISHVELQTSLHRFAGGEVLLLANGSLETAELLAVAARCRESGVLVTLLPTSSMVQALACLAVHDPSALAADDTYAMAEAATNARTGAVVAVEEDSLTILGPCGPGDYVGMVGGEVVVLEEDQYSAGEALADLLLATGGDMVTVLLGADADGDFAERVQASLRVERPEVEVVAYGGGQSATVMEIGVE
ncbi:DAK2 domain-containing protein [Tsukamurella sp. 8F]|uniref:DAK2 domain-containing protein n=1 Tax=Tsukamurella sp. 8F TaxID=3031961 RepID=UPI0023B951B4|nr:DAK2 domain-containing protein [Tsukamurella sp. 8F]MDF0589231.1 DAK2 domain-containing protein [Tsukamurella sp. 8F]